MALQLLLTAAPIICEFSTEGQRIAGRQREFAGLPQVFCKVAISAGKWLAFVLNMGAITLDCAGHQQFCIGFDFTRWCRRGTESRAEERGIAPCAKHTKLPSRSGDNADHCTVQQQAGQKPLPKAVDSLANIVGTEISIKNEEHIRAKKAPVCGEDTHMDWNSAYRADFKQDLKYLRFESRAVRLFELRGSYGTSASLPSLDARDLNVDGDVTRWLDEVRSPITL